MPGAWGCQISGAKSVLCEHSPEHITLHARYLLPQLPANADAPDADPESRYCEVSFAILGY